jgi:hypothetical protein
VVGWLIEEENADKEQAARWSLATAVLFVVYFFVGTEQTQIHANGDGKRRAKEGFPF